MALRLSLAVGCLAVCGAARGNPPQGAADAITAVKAVFDPIAKMAPGPARTQRACADVEKLKQAAKTIPTKEPQDSAVDQKTWGSDAGGVGSTAAELENVCKAPGQKLKDPVGDVRTVDGDLKLLGDYVQGVVEDLKPRALSPAMKTFDQAMRHATPDTKRKHVCKDMAEAAKVVDALEAAPAGVDKAKWAESFGKIRGSFNDAKNFCDPKGDDSSVFDGAFGNVHDSFYELVLLLPAAK